MLSKTRGYSVTAKAEVVRGDTKETCFRAYRVVKSMLVSIYSGQGIYLFSVSNLEPNDVGYLTYYLCMVK